MATPSEDASLSAESKEHQPRRVSLKPSPELLRCRAGAIPDEQRDGSRPCIERFSEALEGEL
jgi:hypothetical protein